MKTKLTNLYLLTALFLLNSVNTYTQKTPLLTIEAAKKKYPNLFDSAKLAHYSEMNDFLIKTQGFKEGYFTTSDDLKINYIYLQRKNASKWVIFCTGWFPGRKEGIATFLAMLPEDCNLFFFDARGHGKSQGPLFSNIWRYGKHEYKDVVGAIKQAHTINPLPILVYGTCAGAFHATHALAHIEKRRKIKKYNIRGLIFDSGWAQVDEVAYTTPQSTLEDMLEKRVASYYGFGKNKEQTRKNWIFRALNSAIKTSNFVINRLFFNPFFKIHYHATNLYNKIGIISIPIFFIHSTDDKCAPITPVKLLDILAKNSRHWWIEEPSKHACHFLKFSGEYQEKINNFIDECC